MDSNPIFAAEPLEERGQVKVKEQQSQHYNFDGSFQQQQANHSKKQY